MADTNPEAAPDPARRRRRVILIAAIPLVGFAALVASLATPLLDGRDPSRLESVLIDRPLPAFELRGLDGRGAGEPGPLDRAYLVEDAADGPILVNFFASWCVPCLAEHPILTRMVEEQGVRLHGIATRDDPADTREWLFEHGDIYARVGVDDENRAGLEWGTTGVPETFVIDRTGHVRHRHLGPITPTVARETLLPLLAELSEAEQ